MPFDETPLWTLAAYASRKPQFTSIHLSVFPYDKGPINNIAYLLFHSQERLEEPHAQTLHAIVAVGVLRLKKKCMALLLTFAATTVGPFPFRIPWQHRTPTRNACLC